jgi:FOG: TPR repeat, SEL1 subfamily
LDEIRAKAEVGDAAAQVQLGDAYDIGAGVKRDVAEAVKWYRKAAEQGDAEGEYSLGGKYIVANTLNSFRNGAVGFPGFHPGARLP